MAERARCVAGGCTSFEYSKKLCASHYSKHARYRRVTGTLGRTSPERAQTKVRRLRDRGWSWKAMADAGHTHPQTLKAVHAGTSGPILKSTEATILALSDDWSPTRRLIPSHGTRRRLQALAWMGWPRTEIIARIDQGTHCVTFTLPRPTVSASVAARVAEIYAELQHSTGPSPRIHRWAVKRSYAPPAAWDDDAIDNPDAKPAAFHRVRRGGRAATEMAEEVAFFEGLGLGRSEIADRMGISRDAFNLAARRLSALEGSAV